LKKNIRKKWKNSSRMIKKPDNKRNKIKKTIKPKKSIFIRKKNLFHMIKFAKALRVLRKCVIEGGLLRFNIILI